VNNNDALYLAIKYIQDIDNLSLDGVSKILQVSNERLKEFMSNYEQN
jgi:DNA-binding transcriptional regulator YbjK